MSHTTAATSHKSASTLTRVTSAMRRTWADARYADRSLMELRTNLSRHSG
jgi:hypothetical protein